MRLTLPEEILGQKAVLEDSEGKREEVHAVPLKEGQLDPVLEEAVTSQPKVTPDPPRVDQADDPEPEAAEAEEEADAEKGKKGKKTSSPLGFFAVLAAGAMVLVGLALGAKGGVSVSSSGNGGGAPGPSVPRGPDLY